MAEQPHVLLVTSPELADPLADLIEAAGCDVTIVSELFEGVAALTAEPTSAVLVDLTMPSGEGAELASWTRGAQPDVRVIGLVERTTTAQALDGHPVCHDTVLLLPEVGDLRRALLLDAPLEHAPDRPALQVTLHAALIDAGDGILPPEAIGEDEVRALLVGQSKLPEPPAPPPAP